MLAGVVSPGEMVLISGTGLGPAQLGGIELTGAGISQHAVLRKRGDQRPVQRIRGAADLHLLDRDRGHGAVRSHRIDRAGHRDLSRQTSAPATVNVAASVPGIFTANASGTGQAAAVNYETGTPNSAASPAAQGSTSSCMQTGEGQTFPAGMDGKLAAAPLPAPIVPVSVTIGGVQAVVQYAGAAYGEVAGMMQLNVVVPSDGVRKRVAVAGASRQCGKPGRSHHRGGGRPRFRIRDHLAGDYGGLRHQQQRCDNVLYAPRPNVVPHHRFPALGLLCL